MNINWHARDNITSVSFLVDGSQNPYVDYVVSKEPKPFGRKLMDLLIFMWHLAHKQVLSSGGLRRFVQVVSRRGRYGARFTVIENSPSLLHLSDSIDYESVEFQIPLDKYEDVLIVRLLIWIYYLVKATITGITLSSKRHFDIAMTSSGELFCTAVPAFMTHALRRIPLAYVVQAAPPGLPSSGFTPEYCRYRRQGFSVLKATSLSFYAYVTRAVLVRLYNRAQLVITVSESLKKQLEQYGVRRRIHVVRNGIDVDEMERVACGSPQIYDAIFVGRITPGKGVFDLIEVWREIVETIPTALLVLIGYCTSDVKKLIDKRIEQCHLVGKIVMKRVPRSELILTLKQSKLFLFLSRQEGAPLVVGEALACGLPVVCYGIPPVQELYRTDAVLSCPVGDIKCIVEKALKLSLDEELRNRLGIKAREFVQRFNWEETAEEEFQLYNSILEH